VVNLLSELIAALEMHVPSLETRKHIWLHLIPAIEEDDPELVEELKEDTSFDEAWEEYISGQDEEE